MVRLPLSDILGERYPVITEGMTQDGYRLHPPFVSLVSPRVRQSVRPGTLFPPFAWSFLG